MRIIGGIHRSRNIVYPLDETKVRPTKDRIREAVFSILQYHMVDKDVLDVFAGSGAYGLESISRGASSVTFIDCYSDSIRCIKENVKTLKIENATIIDNDYLPAIEKLSRNNKVFDIVFLDPPYGKDMGIDAISKLDKVVKDDGIVILETDSIDTVPDKINTFIKYDVRMYGRVVISFFRKAVL